MVRPKAVLFFDVSEEPEIVQLQRGNIQAGNFRPYLDPDNQEGGTVQIECLRVNSAQAFRLYYFEQTTRNGFDLNDAVTRELQGYTDNLMRPWYGPILVVWDDDHLITPENLGEKADEVISYLNNLYEGAIRDESVEFDPVDGTELD